MKRIQKGIILLGLLATIAVFWLLYPENNGVIVLEYHSISHLGGLFCLAPDTFEQQMGYLAQNGYTAISLDQLSAGLNDEDALPAKPVLITFDDGYTDNYTTALPILEKYGLRATVFIITGKVDQPGYLTWAQIKDMLARGIDIGSHTVSHRDLSKLSAVEQEKELKESKKTLEKALSRPIDYLAYPFGGFNAATLRLLGETGYLGAFSGIPGVNTANTNPYILHRIPMLNTKTGIWRFELYLWKLQLKDKIRQLRGLE
ncbi:polysaccharide deacetylase [Lucifera butyrica]|uniref:Polysaccharide deacetylase n=1 Tax=Lucifera butyrica TaxID=1351585 RepID=A0A498RFM5_9FIRM|nr:polysaccharide deacetylase family protein [Lucifera butyrica]VBB09815.1 polysaccharide deacetylase [Lucifera butyrica]